MACKDKDCFFLKYINEKNETIIKLETELKLLSCEKKNLENVLDDFINILNLCSFYPFLFLHYLNSHKRNVARDMIENMGVEVLKSDTLSSDVIENYTLKKRTIKILEQKIDELEEAYQKAAKAGMPTGCIISEIDSYQEIIEDIKEALK